MAAKNWASEGYTQLESGVRGIDETSRSEDKGDCFGCDGSLVVNREDQVDRALGPTGQLSPEWSTGHLSAIAAGREVM